ncbi:Uncharacterized membrane protein [Flavobacterium aquidurense]|uniref:DUF502 domain-containing protein n=1 Tax=Flavobacterium frigidimaris TaxID=262320 RepID=A0ABX4BKH9_FLAFR|nr:hypothetical protein [Flavobacterium frigidimaris]OXA75669.1 hypothetical protein B0A65_20810 [Flavobacterium frigidimaris]SDZ65635.1 Uncharacterized membrane protein [Flavobacterium aquidurense]
MEKFLHQLQKNCISGIILLLPLVVFFMILEKVWGFFRKYGDKVSHILHLDKILGPVGSDILGGLFLILLIYFSGYLVRLSFLKKFADWVDDKLMVFLPGYEKNKKLAEEKLAHKVAKPNPNLPILLKYGEYWQPAHLIEENADGNAVVFVPAAPSKDHGQIYVVSASNIRRLPETTLGSLDESIKSLGKGILGFK